MDTTIVTSLNPSIKAIIQGTVVSQLIPNVHGVIGRGVQSAKIDINGHLILTMTDGQTIDVGLVGTGKIDIASSTTLGVIKVGENLTIKDGVLSVDIATAVEQDNTKPISSGAVHTEVGNIEVLLAAL